MAKNGFILIKPTSILSSGNGNSSSISANGSVLFSSCTSVALNGVFSNNYDTYKIVMRFIGSQGSQNLLARLRTNGNDRTDSAYHRQVLYASGTTVAGARNTILTYFYYGLHDSEHMSGAVGYIYNPYQPVPTVIRTAFVSGDNGATYWDEATTYGLSNSSDGITFLHDTTDKVFSGRVAVYGLRK